MPFNTISLGLTLKVPTRSTKNWDSVLLADLFTPISSHDHSGGGAGNPIPADGLAANSVNDAKIQLRNAQWLRSRNAADTGDINILRVNASDGVELNVALTTTMGSVSINETAAAPTGLLAGYTYFQPNYILGAAITYEIIALAFMEILGFMQVDGTLTVTGELRVI
jgi:hypothetical protein